MKYLRNSSIRGVTNIPGKEHGLGVEHPIWDDLQNVLILLFFVAVSADGISQFYLGFSTVLVNAVSFPILILPTIFFIVVGTYLVKESHGAVLVGEGEPMFVDSGVYSRVRHPIYLGMLLTLLGFLFLEFSLIASTIWVVFFIVCDWMASYEEKDLVRILGKKYIDYQKRVPKWFPRL